MEIKPDMPFAQAIEALGITFEDIIQNVNYIKGIEAKKEYHGLDEEILLQDAVTNYLSDISNWQHYTKITYIGVLKEFLTFMASNGNEKFLIKMVIANVRKTDIENFLSTIKSNRKEADGRPRAVSSYTYNKKLGVISSFFKKYLVCEKGLLSKSPTHGIKYKKEGQPEIRFLTKTEQKKVLAKALKNKENGKRDFILIFLAMSTGPRLDEVVNLDISDVDLPNDTVFIKNGKGGKPRPVYLTDEVKQVLTSYIKEYRIGPFQKGENQPLFLNNKGPNSFKRITRQAAEIMVKRVFRACGITEGALHRLRHTFAVNALQAGLSIVEIQTLLGHENISTTVKYLRLADKDILEKIKKNFPLAFVSIKDFIKESDSVNNKKPRGDKN